MERTRGFRCAWLALMLLQLALPSWTAVADAHLLGPEPQSVHLESDACVPTHPEDCALCSFLQTPVDVEEQAAISAPPTARRVRVPAEQNPRAIGAIAAARLPRGPPLRS